MLLAVFLALPVCVHAARAGQCPAHAAPAPPRQSAGPAIDRAPLADQPVPDLTENLIEERERTEEEPGDPPLSLDPRWLAALEPAEPAEPGLPAPHRHAAVHPRPGFKLSPRLRC